MHVGVKVGLAIAAGGAIGVGAGMIDDTPNTAAGSALTAAGAGTMGVFGASVRNPRFGSPTIGLLGIGIGALWAGVGVTSLLRANNASPVTPRFNPADHLGGTPTPPSTLHPSNHRSTNPNDTGIESGVVEEEVETYGPDGEWLGTEHGTVEVP